MIDLAPLYKAVAIVEVALNTSMITTILLLTSYKFKRAGERDVCRDGLLVMPSKKNKERKINRFVAFLFVQEFSPFFTLGEFF
jgi:hypothetical protein